MQSSAEPSGRRCSGDGFHLIQPSTRLHRGSPKATYLRQMASRLGNCYARPMRKILNWLDSCILPPRPGLVEVSYAPFAGATSTLNQLLSRSSDQLWKFREDCLRRTRKRTPAGELPSTQTRSKSCL